ncbi:MAG: transglutaminase family protein [Alphaproteobacteria bacterium]|nr:transglutaminase family protein [Alphaproteobacteria bacterium]
MIVINLSHSTVYRYRRTVSFGEHRMMFRPRDSHDLKLIDTSLSLSPPATVRWHHDVFGNSIAVATFLSPAETLAIESKIKLEHYVDTDPRFSLEPHAREFPFSYSTEETPDLGRTRERHYPDPNHVVDDWARQFLKNGNPATMEMLLAMTRAIRFDFTYIRREEEGTQSPVETLRKRSGSCRDFALLFMEACRTFGLAARFVSGYLYNPKLANGAGAMVGSSETHAWAQIFLPGAGWVEFDPTNGLVGGLNLIRVAVTRDPRQAIPITGTFEGHSSDCLAMDVKVQVTVE